MKVELAFLAALLNFLDNWTTWVCLRDPAEVEAAGIYEANPIAAWTFELMGLGTGLIFEYILTLGCLVFIVRAKVLGERVRLSVLGFLCLLAGYAAWNNFGVIKELGLAI